MSDEARVQVTIDADGVAQVCLARPDKLNALDAAMFDALIDAGARLREERALRAVVLHGAGRAFCAGLDMASMVDTAAGAFAAGTLLERTHGIANRWQQASMAWRELPVPVIAALHGVAYGGGLQIALGADIRCVAHDAKLCVMEIHWGLVPDMAGVLLMRELCAQDRMRELIYSGRIFSGDEALSYGLATRVSADPLADARALARDIASKSPDAIRAVKRLLNDAGAQTPAQVLLAESREQQALIGSANQIEAVQARLAKRAPQFN